MSPARLIAPLLLIGLLAAPAAAQGPSAGQCKSACAREYYFCLQQSDAETCGPNWAKCQLACERAFRGRADMLYRLRL